MNTTVATGSVGVPLLGRTESAYRGPCRVLGAHITRVARGGTESIICDEYCETGGVCQLRKAALGAPPGLTDVVSESVARDGTRCIMLTA